MKTVFIVAAITIAFNFFVVFGDIGIGILLIPVIELVVGIILTVQKSEREKGQGILLGLALSLLIGFLVCSGFLRM